MGGGGVGRVSIDVDADTSKAASKLKELLTSFPDKQIQSTAKAINSLKSELSGLERAFKGKTLIPGSREANEINRVKDAIERLGGATDRNVNFITRHAVAINQLSFAAARAGHGFANFLPLIARSSTLLAKAANEGGGASGALASLRGAASGASGALAGVSFAAIAAAAAFVLLVVGIGFLIAKLGPLGSELNRAQEGIKNIFGAASEDIQDFAERASTAFGITEQAALVFLGKTGQLFQSFGISVGRSAELSETLLVMTDVLRTVSQEFIDSETAMQAMFNTAAGNIEGLREFSIFLTEISIKETLRAHKINVTTQTLDNQQRSLAALLAANDVAIQRFDQYIKTQDSAARVSERTSAAIKDIKAKLGEGLAPLLAFVANAFLGFLISIKGVIENAQEFFDKHPLIVKALKAIGEAVLAMQPGLKLLVGLVGLFGDKGKEAAEDALDLEERMEKLVQGGKALEDQLAKTFEPTLEQLRQLVDAHNRVKEAAEDGARAQKEALENLSRAQQDSTRKIQDAQRNVFRAYRDRNRAIFDANEKLTDAVEANERSLFDARRRLEEVQLQTSRAIRDAEEKLLDARVDATRRLIKAEEDLAKARRKNALDIVSSFRAVEDAQNEGDVQAERSARFALAEARRGGEITDAKRALNEAVGDSQLKIARLERDLAEERVDARKKIQDAQTALDRAIVDGLDAIADAKRKQQEVIEDANEKIEDSQRKLSEVEVETSRALYDAKQRVLETERESLKAIKDSEEALRRLNEDFGTTDMTLGDILDKLERMKNVLIGMTPLEGTYGRRVGSGTSPGGFAHGGKLSKGEAGWVGEQGRELFIPDRSGTIIPHEQSEKLLSLLNDSISKRQLIEMLREALGGRRDTNTGFSPSIVIYRSERDEEELGFAIMQRLSAEASR